MAAATGSATSKIDAYAYVQVVGNAASASLRGLTDRFITRAIWGNLETEPVGYSNGFSFYTSLGEMYSAAGWEEKQKKYTNAEGAARCFRDCFLAKIDAEKYPYLFEAAVLLDEPDLTALVLEAIPTVAGKKMALDGSRVVAFAAENKKTRVEALLRKHFNLPAPEKPVISSGSAAAPSTLRTPQDLAADFANLADAEVALRDKLLAEFKALPQDFRNQVYGALYQIKPPVNAQQNVMNYGELAFLHQNGLSSTGQEKSNAILAVLGANAKK